MIKKEYIIFWGASFGLRDGEARQARYILGDENLIADLSLSQPGEPRPDDIVLEDGDFCAIDELQIGQATQLCATKPDVVTVVRIS